MSTRGNVVFANNWYIEDKELTVKDFINVRPKSWFIKKSYSIYVHSDMYPSGALPDLQEFLQMNGAKHRATDPSYLSAWFCAYQAFRMLPFTRSMTDRDFDYKNCKNPSYEDMKKSDDWFGFGILQNGLSDWAEYSYLIVPKIEIKGQRYDRENSSFDIYIYDGCFNKFLGMMNTESDIDDYKEASWWY